MPPLTIMIKPVSGRCNMRCRYCFYTDVQKNRSIATYEMMQPALLELLVRRALAYADGVCSFAFQGGEPTLAGVAFYEKLIEYQKKYNTRGLRIQNSIQTNGYEMPGALLDLLARERFLVGVSFDGTPHLHDRLRPDADGKGTSKRVLDTIRCLSEKGVDFNILTVVNEYVAHSAEAVFAFMKKYRYLQYIACLDGFDEMPTAYSLTPQTYGAFLKQTFDLYEQAYYEKQPVSIRLFDNYLGMLMGQQPENCAMGSGCGRYYLIEGDGSVYPCDFYVLDKWRMGNIQTDSFFRLEKSEAGTAFIATSTYTSPKCRACPWHGLCRGGCRRDCEPFVAGNSGPNKWCESYCTLFDYAYARMRAMAQAIAERDDFL